MRFYGFELANIKGKNNFNNQSIGFFKDINLKENKFLKEHEKFISHKNKYFIFQKIRRVNCSEITHKLKANRVMDKDFLHTTIHIKGQEHHGYLLNLFNNRGKGRLKDNNFKGKPYVFKNVNYINRKIYSILNTQRNHCKILTINKFYTDNKFNKILQEYNNLKLNDYLVLELGKDAELLNDNTILDKIENKLLEQKDIIYLGIIPKIVGDKYYPYLFFRKGKLILFTKEEENKFNPRLVINKKEEHNVFILNDCPLMGGTKTRAIVPYISRISEKNIIYIGPTIGFAQMALAYALKILSEKGERKKLKLYFNGHNLQAEHFNITKNIIHIYENIEIHIFCKKEQEFGFNKILSKVRGNFGNLYTKLYSQDEDPKSLEDIKKWVESKNNEQNTYIVPFGLRFPGFVNLLSKQIKKSLNNTVLEKNKGENMRIWLVAGSGAILNTLYIVFPKAEFHILQVGATIWEDVYNKKNTVKYEYIFEKNKIYEKQDKKIFKKQLGKYKFKKQKNIAFLEDVNDNEYMDIPYNSVKNYDAKIWATFKNHYKKYQQRKPYGKIGGKKNNYIWNVACTKTFTDFLKMGGIESNESNSITNINPEFKVYLSDIKITI